MKLLDILTAPWAILPEKKLEIDQIYATHLRGEKIDLKAVEAAIGQPLNNQQADYQVQDGVAILAMDGVLAKRMNLFTKISGGTSMQVLGAQLQQALDDPAVQSILLLIDSPGGSVDGTQELADAIFAARDVKPIVAFADGLMASAAYWTGSSASAVYAASDTTFVGSIGVVTTHTDWSGYEAKMGIKTTEITAGKYKRLASEYAPLTPEGRQSIQDQLDHLYSVFLGAVARNRGVASAEAVHETMGDGRMFIGQQAVDVGLIDGIMTLDALLQQMRDGSMQDMQQRAAGSARGRASAAGVAAEMTTHQENTMADKDAKPAVTADDAKPFVEKALAEAKADFETKLTAARTEGATAERERIQAVFEQQMPGHEALIQQLAFDGKTTGGEAAVAVLKAERAKTAGKLADLRQDATKPAPNAAAPDDKQPDAKDAKIDPKAVAEEARAYQTAQLAQGRRVTMAEAVAHVTKKQEAK